MDTLLLCLSNQLIVQSPTVISRETSEDIDYFYACSRETPLVRLEFTLISATTPTMCESRFGGSSPHLKPHSDCGVAQHTSTQTTPKTDLQIN